MTKVTKSAFKQVKTTPRMKFKFEGHCDTCNKIRFHRFEGGSLYEDWYRCMKCNTVNKEKHIYPKLFNMEEEVTITVMPPVVINASNPMDEFDSEQGAIIPALDKTTAQEQECLKND